MRNAMGDPSLLGQGIYDLGEVARLVRRSVEEVEGWARGVHGDAPLLHARDGRLFSFYDLVTALVVDQLRQRGVPLAAIRAAREYVAREVTSEWPLANAVALGRIASGGRDVYLDHDGDWVDAGRGGQWPFQEIVRPLLDRITFDDGDGMAVLWRPTDDVVVDPRVQAGAPCLAGTRLSTEFVAGLVAQGEDPEDVARDYDVPPEAVRAALDYERGLAA